jgi:Fe-S cluster assembly protein SufB
MTQYEILNILSKKGLSEETVKAISAYKKEPEWMLKLRLLAYKHYQSRAVPSWGADLSDLKDDNIQFFIPPEISKKNDWKEIPENLKSTFDNLKIPEAEQKFLSGVETQYDSNVIYGKIKKKWEDLGVIFTNMEDAVSGNNLSPADYEKCQQLLKRWFGKVIPFADNKYAALNTACWSGGSFVYIPKGVKLDFPLQAYFYIKMMNLGQFERTMIIADEGSEVQYIEGCSAPNYESSILHSGVIELIALPGSRIRYTTIQNWSKSVYNLVTQRGIAHDNAIIEWVDCNIGSKVTMKYPAVILKGKNSHGEVLSMALADKDQHIDSGAKMTHIGENSSSVITTKSICKNGGRVSYRGLVKIRNSDEANKLRINAKSKVKCDSLIMDDISRTDTYPYNDITDKFSRIEHEATVSKISQSQLFYLMSKGLSEQEADGLIVAGFIEPISRELPMEYALEMNNLIRMSMEGSVG